MYLNEHFITLIESDDMLKYSNIVWNMLNAAYKEIGGFLTAKSENHLIRKSSLWKLVRQNNKILACAIYTSKNGGRKLIAAATDGSLDGKNALYSIIKEDIKMMNQRQAWAELSGKMEYIYNKFGGVVVPSKYVTYILKNKKIFDIEDDGHYSREISNIKHRKIIYGWIDPEIKNYVDNQLNESYNAIDFLEIESNNADKNDIEKYIRTLFNESGRILSMYYDNFEPLRQKDKNRIYKLKNIYKNLLNHKNISSKFKDYIELEIDDINDLLNDIE